MRPLKRILVFIPFFYVLAFIVASCGGEEDGPTLTPDQQEIVGAVSQACSGVGIEGASLYSGTPRLHPIVVLNAQGKQHDWTARVPPEWWPESVEDTELIACIGELQQLHVQTCEYFNGPPIHRYVYQLNFNVWEAQSGRLIQRGSITGAPPRECLKTERFELTELHGAGVPLGQALDSLRGFAHPEPVEDPFDVRGIGSFLVAPTGLTIGAIDDVRYLWLTHHPIKGNIAMYEYPLSFRNTINPPSPAPGGLAFDGAYLWTADASEGKIYKLDIATNILDSFDSPVASPNGLAFDGAYLWTADASEDKIYKLDTAGNILNTFDSPGPSPRGLAFDGAYLWITDAFEDRLYKLDAAGNIIDAVDPAVSTPDGLAFDGTYLWAAHFSGRKVYKLDTAGNVVDSFDFVDYSEASGLAFDGNHLWIPGLSSPHPYPVIHKSDTAGNILNSIYMPTVQPSGLAFDGTHLWAVDPDKGKIFKLSVSPNIIDAFDAPGPSPSGLTFDGTHLWIADASEGKIYRLNTAGNILDTLASPGPAPSGLTFDGTHLWTADTSQGMIYQLDTAGNILDTLASPGPAPTDLAYLAISPGPSPKDIPFIKRYLYVIDSKDKTLYEMIIK